METKSVTEPAPFISNLLKGKKALVTGVANKRSIAWGRAGKPEEVAAAFAFLASDDAEYITGESLTIDGGQMAALTEPGLFEEWSA